MTVEPSSVGFTLFYKRPWELLCPWGILALGAHEIT